MSEDLISKKELLDLTGISYGQLYRWKRKNLIPEDWFIRKSSFTGQETYFPRQQILPRIDKILNMKDGLSLDELADVFSPALGEVQLERHELLGRNIVSEGSLVLYKEVCGEPAFFNLDQTLALYVLDKLLRSGEITREEGRMLLGVMSEHYGRFAGKPCDLVLLRKMGVPVFLLAAGGTEYYADSEAKMVIKKPIGQFTEELKLLIGK
ncbi:YhbD family protein [Paenibacillus pinistramenti]|uniref:YhbD family protein n=1 Tax=Paenibacillus pinistramenti TaxID=1768003 RepID=UPI0011084DF5|nr:YhbD family protein [Paenibacillus pinistramenti]